MPPTEDGQFYLDLCSTHRNGLGSWPLALALSQDIASNCQALIHKEHKPLRSVLRRPLLVKSTSHAAVPISPRKTIETKKTEKLA